MKKAYKCNNCGDIWILNTDALDPETWLCKKCRKLDEKQQGNMEGYPGNVIDSQDMKGRGE
jgi:predicted RNA-binding Zn-ribbon protein involved in translation (DUF1610 family)